MLYFCQKYVVLFADILHSQSNSQLEWRLLSFYFKPDSIVFCSQKHFPILANMLTIFTSNKTLQRKSNFGSFSLKTQRLYSTILYVCIANMETYIRIIRSLVNFSCQIFSIGPNSQFVQIEQMCLSKLQHIFVKSIKCICKNYLMYLFKSE